MTADKRFFDARIRRTTSYMAYSEAVGRLPGYDDVKDHKIGRSLFVYADNGDRVFTAPLPTDDAGIERVLDAAAGDIYAHIRSEAAKFDNAVSQAVITFADAEGLDAKADFEGAMKTMLLALREKCDLEGWDFDGMSRDPALGMG